MSTAAYAIEGNARVRRRARWRGQGVVSRIGKRVDTPWADIPLHVAGRALPVIKEAAGRVGIDALALVALVVAAHFGIAWFVLHHRATDAVPPPKHEVKLAFERPPPPKLEPPKPPPRTPRVAKVVPQIEEAPPVPSEVPPVASPEPPVAVAPVVSAPPPPPLPVTAPIGRAGYLNNPPPPYPPVAMRLGLEGTVLLQVRVLSSGRVESVQVQKSSGSPPLDDAAVLTVKKWLFTPSKRGDTPIDGWATVPIEFKLDQ
jgi:protein TonB